jgi:nitrogen-specific signal transduction histidine kinase
LLKNIFIDLPAKFYIHAIVKHHNGFLECTRKEREATVFNIYFPALGAE